MSRYFWPILTPSPVTLCYTSRDLPKSTSHISDPQFLVGLVQKTRTKPLYKFSVNYSRGFCSQWGFVRGSFGWKVSSGAVFVRSSFCQNTSVNRKLNITLNFMIDMYDNKMYKRDVKCSWHPPLSPTD